ncbi:SinI family autotransporter-associated protein [Budvicia aquatica]|uniref:Ornithine carbamoyltransferase n=1 Tax=Budvicia aquatica TaxID=82979 RepID=A0A2C6DJW8_9GAMM|nr:SinI family autotransporter-associated protein [Budvicia aquatica]PHI28993.1 ornithine carbamoyltransferase [Budvicia aquatica]VFS47131.1 Uncharacterised protein [Budvicia aquatica]
MKKSNTFTLKKLVLALALAGYTMSSAYAVMTAPTGTIQGTAPVLSAPLNSAQHAVDLSSNAVGATLATGDTVTVTYKYSDAEGDEDDSTTYVTWYEVRGGVDTQISTGVVNTAAAIGGNGTSVLTIPASAAYASAIKVVIQEYSASGDPIFGQILTVGDTGVTGPNNPTVTPPGPVAPGSNVTPGIYASTDSGFGTNLLDPANSGTPLNVGDTYVFKLWDSAAVGTTDLTPVSYNWHLLGTSATDGVNAPAASIQGAGSYTIPANVAGTALTGSADGVQGFSLAVDY